MGQFQRPTLLLCGPSGVGKSSEVIRTTNPKATYWICAERGALLPATNSEINPSGIVPDFDEATDLLKPWEQTITFIKKGIEGYRAGRYSAIVLDTISSLADREYLRVRNAERITDKYGAANRALRVRILPVIWELLNCGALIIAISHDKEPVEIDGHLTVGGPRLPGDLIQTVPSLFDMVLRVRRGANAEGRPERVFRFDPMDNKYVDKDRFGVVKDGDKFDLKRVLGEAVARTAKIQGAA